MKTIVYIVLVCVVSIGIAQAQETELQVSAAPTSLWGGFVDFDNYETSTQNLELMIGGNLDGDPGSINCYGFDNDGEWNLVDNLDNGMGLGDGTKVNLNGDNLPDVASISRQGLRVFRNDGGGTFTEVFSNSEEYLYSSIVSIDIDDDGDEDLYFTAQINQVPVNGVIENTGGGLQIISPAPGNIPATSGYDGVASIDMDGDTDKDLVIMGGTGSGLVARVYRNDGAGIFTLAYSFQPLFGYLTVKDIGGSSLPDITTTGDSYTAMETHVYENLGNMNFTERSNTGLPPMTDGSKVEYGDFNNDNVLDAVLVGSSENYHRRTEIHWGIAPFDFNGDVMELQDENGDELRLHTGNIAVADYNHDGYDDFVLTGAKFQPPTYVAFTNLYTQVESLGVDDHTIAVNAKVFPNPTSGLLNLELPQTAELAAVAVYNMLGQQVMQRSFSNAGNTASTMIDFSSLASGTYVLKASVKDYQGKTLIITKKIIKR